MIAKIRLWLAKLLCPENHVVVNKLDMFVLKDVLVDFDAALRSMRETGYTYTQITGATVGTFRSLINSLFHHYEILGEYHDRSYPKQATAGSSSDIAVHAGSVKLSVRKVSKTDQG